MFFISFVKFFCNVFLSFLLMMKLLFLLLLGISLLVIDISLMFFCFLFFLDIVVIIFVCVYFVLMKVILILWLVICWENFMSGWMCFWVGNGMVNMCGFLFLIFFYFCFVNGWFIFSF